MVGPAVVIAKKATMTVAISETSPWLEFNNSIRHISTTEDQGVDRRAVDARERFHPSVLQRDATPAEEYREIGTDNVPYQRVCEYGEWIGRGAQDDPLRHECPRFSECPNRLS